MLQLFEDLEFQRKEWRVQRIGWACMVLLIIAGALGAAGSGPLSTRTAVAPDGGLTVTYERFLRREAPSTLELRVAPTVDPVIWVSADYLDRIGIRSITPAPREQRLGTDRHVFVFAPAPAATPAPGGGTISIEVEPHAVGSLVGEAGVVGGPTVSFRQLVLP